MHLISRNRALGSMVISALMWLFLLGAVTVGAQAAATPITLGENKTGSITDASSAALYSIEVGAPQSVIVLVLAVTPGFAPTFRVLAPGGLVVLDTANPGTLTIAQGTPNLSSSGTYTIEVHSANNTTGEFLISVQPGTPLLPPQTLTPGTPLNGSVDEQTMRQAYSFSGSANDVLLLTVRADDPVSGAVIALRDADTDETLGLSGASLGGVSYRILTGQRNYLLEVTSSGASAAQAFTVCLTTESASNTCPGATAGAAVVEATTAPTLIAGVPSETPTFAPVAINPGGACEVTPARNNSVNVRSGAGTSFGIVTSLPASATGLVVGRLADNSWYQINVNGKLGWVSATVIIPGGSCSGVAVVVLPTAVPPTAVPPSAPSDSGTTGGSGSPAPDTSNQAAQFPANTLNVNGSPRNGEVSLIQDFGVNPYSAEINVRDQVYVNDALGSGCFGYTNTAPNFRLHYGGISGAGDLLRFFFISDGDIVDAAMFVRDPDGNFHCNEDSFDTDNPTVDFTPSQVTSGDYDVWIANTYSGPNGTANNFSGYLYISNFFLDHP